MKVDGIEIESDLEGFDEEEARKYIEYVKARVDNDILTIEVKKSGAGEVDVEYTLQGTKFERIRRITGYLTGDLSSWNNAKRAEESERVKHF